jgi:hypothetical protein
MLGIVFGFGSVRVATAATTAPTPPTVQPASPPTTLPYVAPIGPFVEPVLEATGGYEVTCNIAAMSADCSHLISSTGPPLSGLSPTSPAALVTMLVNVPSAYQYLQNWVPYDATTSTSASATPSADPTYDLAAASGSGETTGEEMTLTAEDSWSVPGGDTADVAATMNSGGNTLRCGALIGQFGSRYLNYPVPFYAPNGSTYSPNDTNLADVTYDFEVANAQNANPVCVVLTTGGGEVFGASFPFGLAYPRQNALYARIIQSGSAYPTVGPGGVGWTTTNYFQPSAGHAYEAWESVSVADDPPYYTYEENNPADILIAYLG